MIRRRQFVTGMAASGAAALLGLRPESVAAEPPPETTTIRLFQKPLACFAPLFVAEPLLIAEGFRRVEYVPVPTLGLPPVGTRHGTISVLLNAGHIDLGALDPPAHILSLDAGGSAVLLAGLHAGCYKLLASERIRTVRDLKGKTVAVPSLGRHAFVASIASYVGLDPRKDIVWANATAADSMRLFADGLDAFLGFAPEPEELLARKVGHVLVDTLTDKQWSQHFCCILAGSREFVRKNPVATKRALRAILKANEICSADPERAVRAIVARGYARGYDTALQLMRQLPYARWRDYDTEATVRFYALRLREADMIRSTPQQIIAQSTDWRFLNELKKELKG
jgi:NitT/TauT family transport system substrate-binding protein